MSSTPRILHLEDDLSDVELVRAILGDENVDYEVDHVETRDKFLTALHEGKYDLVLSDYSLPTYDGLSALKDHLLTCPHVPFIMFTGTLGEDRAVEVLKKGATDYIAKEYYQRLAPAITRSLKEARERQQRREAERELQQTYERFFNLVNSAPSVIYSATLGAERFYSFVSDNLLNMFGYAPHEMIDDPKFWLARLHPEDRVEALELFERQLQKGQAGVVEYRFKSSAGQYIWLQDSFKEICDVEHSSVEIVGSWTDITERKQMEEQLRKLAGTVEQSPESIVITDLNARIEYANQAFYETTGYSRNEIVGQNPRVLQSGNTSPETYTAMWDALTHGLSWKGEFHNRRKNGEEYIEVMRVTPIRQPNGPVTHYAAVKEDITEKKRLSVELDRHRFQLEELVVERTAELTGARQEAEAANQAKSAFLANMSHEIRTPMNAIVGLTHLMQQAGPSSKQKEQLNKIDSSGKHLLSIINDILDLSKIEAGKLNLEQSDFHLDAIFDHIQSLFNEQAIAKDLTFEIHSSEVPHWLRGDLTRVRQALLNYVGNAVKFTEQGTISMHAIKLEENDEGVLLRFEVRDTGIGIEPDVLTGLFEAFEQADTSTTRKYGGTGLGLVITRRLAQLMGGEAGAKSEMGKGSTFWFTARLARGHGPMPTTVPSGLPDAETQLRAEYAGTRILLAEDNIINCEVAVALLSGAGLAVDTAVNGAEAVAMLAKNTYALVLMDVQMPVMDGLEATRTIRAGGTDLPILAMTANVFAEDRRDCLEAGMNDFVAKPFDLETLFSTILKWLQERET